jgi:starch synthase
LKIILSHAGKQHAYHVAKAMQDLDVLEGFYTSSYMKSRWLQELVLKTGMDYWTRRFLYGLNGHKIHPHWQYELKELFYSRIYGKSSRTQNAVYERDCKFDRYMAKKIPNLEGDIFWGFQGSCFDSLISAKESGKLAIYELPSAYVLAMQSILEEERELHPDWSDSFAQLNLSDDYLNRLNDEPRIADKVIAPSTFCKNTLIKGGIDDSKISTLFLGVEIENIPFIETGNQNRPLRILYVGRISQAKGIVYLLDAIKEFKTSEVQLTLLGYVHGSGHGLKKYKDLFQLQPSISQNELFKRYHEYDVLVFPSVFEGFGFVIIEALAVGLPVITTANTVGPDVIEHDKNGYIVPIRDSNAIAECIRILLNKSNDEFKQMRIYSRQSAMRFTWDKYKERLSSVIMNLYLEQNNFHKESE